MDRRHFLLTSTAAAVALSQGIPSFAENVKPKGKAKARFGVLSDIHIVERESTEYLEKALRYFREKGVAGVVIAGDLADWGTDEQLQYIEDVWERVFPENDVERLFVCGNHDMIAKNYKSVKKFGLPEESFFSNHPESSWKSIFKEDWKPIWIKEVAGFTFVGAHYADGKTIPGLKDFLDAHADRLKGDKPFFFVQHMHPKDTCSAPWTWGQDDGTVTEILSHYPNAISFSGHSHTSLTDDRTLWQGSFTSVGTGSLKYLIPFGARENSKVFETKEKVPSQMPVIQCKDGKHGQLMTIWSNCITLERREFANDEALGTWVIPLPLSDRPLTFEGRAAESVAPQFASGAAVTVTEADGVDRYDVPAHQITVHFPTALSTADTPRAFDYEVCVEMEDVDTLKTIMTKRVFSQGYYMGEKHDVAEVTCVFADTEITAVNRRWRFSVRPCNCYGRKGEAIVSDWR